MKIQEASQKKLSELRINEDYIMISIFYFEIEIKGYHDVIFEFALIQT